MLDHLKCHARDVRETCLDLRTCTVLYTYWFIRSMKSFVALFIAASFHIHRTHVVYCACVRPRSGAMRLQPHFPSGHHLPPTAHISLHSVPCGPDTRTMPIHRTRSRESRHRIGSIATPPPCFCFLIMHAGKQGGTFGATQRPDQGCSRVAIVPTPGNRDSCRALMSTVELRSTGTAYRTRCHNQ